MKSGKFVIPLLAVVSVALAQANLPPNTQRSDDSPPQASTSASSSTVGGAAGGLSSQLAVLTQTPTSTGADALTTTSLAQDGKGTAVVETSTAVDTNTAAGAGGGPVATNASTKSTNGENPAAYKALTGVFAALFAIALAGAVYLLIKRRQDRRKAYLSPAYSSPETGYSDKSANVQIESLQTQLADANKRLTAVQGSLLAAGQKPQTKDDNSLSREYTQIGTDLVGWAGNYFKASAEPINLTTELYEFLTEHVPNYQSLLTSGKSKQLVVRAIASQVLQESFENGAFFGNAMSAITPLVRTSTAPAPAINSWRSETFFLLEKSDDFTSQRRAAVSTIADKIEQLTYPLAASKQTFQGDSARYKFLEGVIRRASDFALALGKQRANFQVLSEPAGCEFGHVTMDDVSQQTDIATGSDGVTTHPLEGRPIQATVFPLLLKYGNESSEGYDQITILSKAKVLV